MSFLVHTLMALILFFAVVWLAVFGGFGAVLAHARGGIPSHGFALGALLGPVGWGTIFWRTRRSGGRGATVSQEAPAQPAATDGSVFDEGFTL